MTVETPRAASGKRRFLLNDEKRSLLAQRLRDEGMEAPARPPIPRRSGAGPAPLSFTQQRFWFLHQLDPASTAYTIAQAVRTIGPLAPGLLEAALGEVVRRHEALRTTFVLQDGQPVQVAGPMPAAVAVTPPAVDLSALPADRREAEARRAADSLVATPFDLARGPLLRAAFFTLAAEDRVLLLTMHHIVSDGWSIGVLLREVALLCEAFAAGCPSPLPPLPLQIADYAVWQRGELTGEALESRLAYWRERLAGCSGVLDLPTDRPRPPVQGFHGKRVRLALGHGPTEVLRATALSARATPFMLLTAALQALLHRYSGQEDVVVGAPVANRAAPEIAGLIGPFVNTLVLRGDLSGDPPFLELLARSREMVLGAEAHQDLPFELLVDSLRLERDLSRNPLFQVLFAYQNIPLPDLGIAGVTLSRFELAGGGAQLDLNLNLAETPDGLVGYLEARADLFDAPTAARMAGHFRHLLTGLMDAPDSRLSELPLLGAAERFQVLEEWNDTVTDYGGELVLHRLIEAQVARTPNAVAAVFENESLNYRELDRRANQLARRLRALGCGPESCVGVYMERSLEMSVALLGILKAGGAYLPLDPEYPRERLAYMIESSGAPVLLTQAHLTDSLPPHGTRVLVLDATWDEIARESPEPLHLEIDPGSPAYVIYTSGSTGRPKGVLVPHRGVSNRLLWMQDAYRLTAEDRILQKTPFSFDVSVWELFWPLLTGARLVYARPGGHRDGAYLVRLIVEQGITTLHFVPSMLQVFLEEPVEECRSLRRVFCSGEALPRDLQDRLLSRLDTGLHNLYGPTEASIDVTAWACGSDTQTSVPIGRPIANTRILLLDRSLRPVPVGVPGELCIGGIGLARGYLGRPELTAERFIPDPFAARPGERLYRTGDLTRFTVDGAIEYLGRLDYQVKVRGFRIELGEIEAALAAHPRVREAVVVAREGREGRQGDRRLVAYLVADLADGEAPPVDELRQALGARLPDYMVPAAFVTLESFPLTSSGKVDRKALPEPSAERPGLEQPFVAPTSLQEAAWAEIWREVLGIDRVGILDNFFALGGDSIRSIQVLARARERGLSATLQQIFQQQTIHGLLEAQVSAPIAPAARVPPFGLLAPGDRERLPAGTEDAYPLSALQAGMLFHSEYNPETAVFHDVFGFHVRAPLDLEALRAAVGELTARHATLRTSFLLAGPGEPLQVVHQEMKISVDATDLRSLDPAEQRAALQSWTEEERRQGFDWALPPLVRFHVHRRGDDSFQLTLSFHHALLDGWSVASLLSELFQRYVARLGSQLGQTSEPTPAPALRSTLRDFVALEREALASPEQRAFWQRDLAGRTATLLPRWPRPAENVVRRVRKHRVPLSDEVSLGLLRLASSLGVPVKSTLLASHLRVLHLLTGQVDLITGLVANGRPEERDGERILGLFLNTLPFRLELRGGTWRELVRQTFAAERERLPFRRFPLAEIQRMLGGEPLFETAFNFVSFHVYTSTAGLSELEVLDAEVVEETNFPLGANFRLEPGSSRIQLALDWDTSELRPEQVEALAGYYVRTLAAMAATPDARLETASLLAPEEMQLLVVEPNDTRTADRLSLCVHRLFEEQAARSPAATALVLSHERGEERLTYGELNAWANRLARRLRGLGVGPETVVGLCAERSFAAIAGILAVLKAGGAYLPLDPAYPPERLSFLLEDARVPVLLCQQRLLERLPPHGARVVLLDPVDQEERETPNLHQNLHGGATPHDPVYVIYTSGSTGQPKGVVALHGGLANFALAMVEKIGLGPSHRFLEFASLSFDASALQIFPTLVSGAALVLHPDPASLSSHEILRLCERHGVTVLDLPAALWRQFVEDTSADSFGSAPISVFLTGGESVSVARLRSWAGVAPPGALFLSSYGPTEATVTTTFFTVTREQVNGLDGRVIPLGRLLPNTRLHLLDRHLEPVPLAVPGEICIGGAGITRGYLERPGLTAQAFTPDPFSGEPGARLYRTGDMARRLWDGNLEFLGRFDHQVKIRGFRVEPGEIEAVLATCPEVADAAVVIREDKPGDMRLVAYVVPDPARGIDPRALRDTLQEKLPPHMVPSTFVVLRALPATANGKLDRQALPAPTMERAAGLDGDRPYRAPQTPVEQTLAQVWSEVLRVERVGLDDSFFELGGHSLIAVQMIGRLRETFQVDLPLRLLYEATTLAGLAAAIEQLQAGGAETAAPAPEVLPPLVPDRAGRFLPFPLTPIQQTYWTGQSELFELGGTGSNVYNELEVSGLLHVFLSRLKAALPRWIERHEMLRSVVLPDGRQRILERVPRYVPKVVDLRGLDPSEVHDRLEAARGRMRFAPVVVGEWPPFEIVLFRLDGGRLRICARISALVLDGTSRGVMMQDLFRLMADPNAPFPPLDLSFRDYAVAREALRETEAGRRSRDFWMKRLPGLPPAPDLPRAPEGRLPVRPRFVIRSLELLDAESWLRLRTRAARAGLTPTGAVLAAFVDVLTRFARTPRFTLSLVGSERFPLHPQVGEITGNFNTIHLLEVDGWEGSFETRARRLRDRLATDQELPFFSGLEVLRELNRLHGNRYGATLPVLFNSVIEYNENENGERRVDTSELSGDDSVDVQDIELNIYAPQILFSPTMQEGEDGELRCKWQAVEDAFPPGLLSEMAVAFEHRLRELANSEESWQAHPASLRAIQPESSEAPRNTEEEEVAALWRDLLGTGDFGIRDEFFAVGGDSFGVVRLLARLEERILTTEPAPPPGLWRRLWNRLAHRRPADADADAGGEVAAARTLLRERLMAAFVQEPTVENLAAVVRRERAARAAEVAELAPAPLPAGVKAFTWIWFGQLVSMLGTGLGSFALGLWVYRATGSVTEFAFISVFGALASLVASPIAGTLVDRWDRRRIMIVSDAAAACCSLALVTLLFTDRLQVWHVYVIVAGLATAAAFQQPAFLASVSLLVPRRFLGRANGMAQLGQALAQTVAPMIAGALLIAVDLEGIIALDLVTFVFGAAMVLRVAIPNPAEPADRDRGWRALLRDSAQGWRYVRERPGLLGLLTLLAAANLSLGMVQVLVTPLVLSFASAAVLGTILSVSGVGMVTGSLAMALWGGPRRLVRTILGLFLVEGVLLMVGGLRPNAILAGLAALVFLICQPIINGSNLVIWQRKVPAELQGRVLGLQRVVAMSALPVAFAVAGPLADRVFEPLLAPGGALAGTIGKVIGTGDGRGIGLMFILLGLVLVLTALLGGLSPRLRNLERELPDAGRERGRRRE